jgi:two-component system NtrC family sensor kinase
MLENDKGALENTLDIIHTLPGIDEVNLYANNDSLVYSSYSFNTPGHGDPDCKSCHPDIHTMFPLKEKSYRLISDASVCNMAVSNNDSSFRQLMIRSPIFNEKSCYTASCHAHSKSDEVLGSLIIKIPLEELDAAVLKSTTEFFLFAALSTFLLVFVLIFFTRKKVKEPLNAIISASEAVARGDRDMRLEIKPNLLEDMRMVSIAFNNMLDNLNLANKELRNWSQQLEYKVQIKSEELSEIQNELIHVERIASLGKLSSSVAHEINNPLSGVLTYTKLVHKQLEKLEVDFNSKNAMLKYLTVIESETKRCGDIVKGLLDFSRKDQKNSENKHLHAILQDTYNLMAHQMKISDINFYTDFSAEHDLVHCNENQLKQACVAILVNACEAMSGSGEIIILTKNPDPESIRMDISDTGIGISEEDKKHIFEPFFSAKKKTNGIGLGLAIVHGIVQSHKGKIDIQSEVGKGTTVSITLPLIKK